MATPASAITTRAATSVVWVLVTIISLGGLFPSGTNTTYSSTTATATSQLMQYDATFIPKASLPLPDHKFKAMRRLDCARQCSRSESESGSTSQLSSRGTNSNSNSNNINAWNSNSRCTSFYFDKNNSYCLFFKTWLSKFELNENSSIPWNQTKNQIQTSNGGFASLTIYTKRPRRCVDFKPFFVELKDNQTRPPRSYCVTYSRPAFINFDDARSMCERKGGASLPHIESISKMATLTQYADDCHENPVISSGYSRVEFWVGVRKEVNVTSPYYHVKTGVPVPVGSPLWETPPTYNQGEAAGFLRYGDKMASDMAPRTSVVAGLMCELMDV